MKVLVINCGSSSLKYQLIDMVNEEALAQGLVERIGIEGSVLTQKVEGKDKYIVKEEMKDHKDAIRLVLEALVDENNGVIKSMDEISAVGHRVVHGGEKYKESVVINDEVKANIEECFKLAPLHNPANMIGCLLYTSYPLNMDSYEALRALAKKGKVFDIIFIDPPYCKEMIPEAMKIIKEHKLLKEEGIIVTKIDSIEEIYEGYEDIVLTKSKKYGNTTVCYYRVDSKLE